MGVKVTGNGKVNIEVIKLRKGDIVEVNDKHYGMVVAKADTNDLQVLDLTYVQGNHWGKSFEAGTTVAEFNRTHFSRITGVYSQFDVEITINLGGN